MSRRRQLLWKVFPVSVLVTVLALVAVGGYAAISLRSFLYDDTKERLKADARLLAKLAAPLVEKGDREGLLRLSREEGAKGQVHVTVVLPSGEVIADSHDDPARVAGQGDREEFRQAMESGSGQSIRPSEEKPSRKIMHVAVAAQVGEGTRPVPEGTPTLRVVAVVRVSRAVTSLVAAFEGLVAEVSFAVLVVALVATLLSYLVARRVTRPLEVMQDGAERFANGDLTHRLQVRGSEELSGLAEALNRMAGQLDERIRTITHQKNEIQKLEQVRSDFVANVSHELRTPITSIKGFVETLRDGAMNDAEAATGFLDIIARQSDRLSNIIDDLLALSRLELSEGRQDVAMEPVPVADVLQAAVVTCSNAAETKRIRIDVAVAPGLTVQANAPLLEQGVTNLLDNAVKYSDVGTTVELTARTVTASNGTEGGTAARPDVRQSGVPAAAESPDGRPGRLVPGTGRIVEIRVTDHGSGIASEHLPRIFERFYRVDKGRSRSQGGTGLGLSIVKHIVNLHHGTVTVESEPGKGSTFAIRLDG